MTLFKKIKRNVKNKKFKAALTLIFTWAASKIGLFKVLGLMFFEDLLAMKVGSDGISIINIILIFGISLIIYTVAKKT